MQTIELSECVRGLNVDQSKTRKGVVAWLRHWVSHKPVIARNRQPEQMEKAVIYVPAQCRQVLPDLNGDVDSVVRGRVRSSKQKGTTGHAGRN